MKELFGLCRSSSSCKGSLLILLVVGETCGAELLELDFLPLPAADLWPGTGLVVSYFSGRSPELSSVSQNITA